jgi:PadR family transcriptional regulator, regulatory protein PadR
MWYEASASRETTLKGRTTATFGVDIELYIGRILRVNLTYPTTLVLQAVANGFHYGFDVIDATALPSGTVYPILRRLERESMVRARWEKAEIAQREQRPPRRYYELTAQGEALLETALARYRAPQAIAARARRLRPARQG